MSVSEHHEVRELSGDELEKWRRLKRKQIARSPANGNALARKRHAREVMRKYKRVLEGSSGRAFKK